MKLTFEQKATLPKVCTKCGLEKPRSEFTLLAAQRTWHGSCKACNSKAQVARHQKMGSVRSVWLNMISRCRYQNHKSYAQYGGRGIKVCAEWNKVREFIKWAHANGYEKGLFLDRIDNNGHYCPENCRFITAKESSRNRRNALSEPIVARIKRRIRNGDKLPAIAASYGVSVTVIRDIRRGDTWSDIEPVPEGAIV